MPEARGATVELGVQVLDHLRVGRDSVVVVGGPDDPVLEPDQEVEVVEGELRSYERVHAAVRGSEVVFHLGALGSVPRSVQDPLTSSAVNVEGTLNVLLAARDENVRRVVFSSSSSVYGSTGELPRTEEMAPDPISPYGVAKLAAERYCVSFSRVYESFEAVVLRYVQDLSYDEAAQVLGQPVGTVKSNVHRALKLLRGENHDRAND